MKKPNPTVVCGVLRHKIYITDPNDKSFSFDCTDNAIKAVCDYMIDDMPKGQSSVGYKLNRNGKTIKLVCIVED